MIYIIKKIGFLFLTILLVSFLVGAQTTTFNLVWLSSVDMPVSLGVLISSVYHDFLLMTLTPAPPLPLPLLPTIIALGFLIAFSFTLGKGTKENCLWDSRCYSTCFNCLFDAFSFLWDRYVGRSQNNRR